MKEIKVFKALYNIIFWCLTVFFGLGTLVSLIDIQKGNIVLFITYGLMTLCLCPKFIEYINKKFNKNIKWYIQLLISFVILIIGLSILDTAPKDAVTTNSNTTNTQVENEENQQQETEEEKQARFEREAQEKAQKEAEEKAKKEQEEAEEKARKEKEVTDFKASCQTYTYKDIARNPSNYNGKNMKFTGKVLQVSESSSWFSSDKNATILLNVTKDEYGFYDDTIYCNYTYKDGEDKILEDDIITIYGTCKGETSYYTVLGAKNTIPEIDIQYYSIDN